MSRDDSLSLMDHAQHCDLLAAEVERFAAASEGATPSLPIPSCPAWTLADLILHLGRVHRWAERLVAERASQRIPFADMKIALADPSPGWIRSGGSQLVATLRAASPEAPMWAWGVDQHVRFWSRRQLHETLVHRLDVELAGGVRPNVDAAVAADAIDELLTNLAPAGRFSPKVSSLRGAGEVLAIVADDTPDRWAVTLRVDGFDVARDQGGSPRGSVGGSAAATIAGPASALLLALYRRTDLSSVAVSGETALAAFFWEGCALE